MADCKSCRGLGRGFGWAAAFMFSPSICSSIAQFRLPHNSIALDAAWIRGIAPKDIRENNFGKIGTNLSMREHDSTRGETHANSAQRGVRLRGRPHPGERFSQ